MEKMDQDDKFPDLFPDLLYIFLLQLGSSHGPEAASPVLKTWRLVHTGPLPQEMTLQRCSGADGQEGGTPCKAAGLGWSCPSSFSLDASGLHKSFREWAEVISLTTFPRVCPVWCRLPSVETLSPVTIPLSPPQQPYPGSSLSRVTIKSMQLLVKRIDREPLEQALEEQSVWSLLENGGTFLEGVSLMARWGQVSQGCQGSAEA